MNNSTPVLLGTKGQTICRPTTLVDVLKFFLLNYVLHVLTVVTPPGSRTFPTAVRALSALLLPFSGIGSAFEAISRFQWHKAGPLQTANAAGALCMLIPKRLLNSSAGHVHLGVTDVHGQHPVLPAYKSWFYYLAHVVPPFLLEQSESIAAQGHHPALPELHQNLDQGDESNPLEEFSLIMVPKSFTVAPLSDSGFTPLTLSCNYNVLKALVAILQVVYSSLELRDSSTRQLPKFGYAAYSLTVIPYLIMSLLNLVATLCEPEYPTMFLVRYGGDPITAPIPSSDTGAVSPTEPAAETAAEWDRSPEFIPGIVGEAYGRLSGDLTPASVAYLMNFGEPRTRPGPTIDYPYTWRTVSLVILGVIVSAVPYATISYLTHFNGQESTLVERGFVMTWLTVGLVYGWFSFSTLLHQDNDIDGIILRLVIAGAMGGVGAIGGFILVGKMMMADEVCIVL